MKNIAGKIIRRLLAVAVFLGCSAVICCGIAKSNSNEKAAVHSIKECCCSKKKNTEDMRPSQLVSIRIMQLI
ncbi:MAG TPA: hypothetical protein VH396_01210 [Chitinophagaceae bacterium]|jgi:hypothetical protein